MSKRPHGESREERWMRKLKMYEEKLEAKRKRRTDQSQNIAPNEQDVQNEEHTEHNEAIQFDGYQPNETEDLRDICNIEEQQTRDVEYDDYTYKHVVYGDASEITETTACTSPCSFTTGERQENLVEDEFDPSLLQELGNVEADPLEFGDDLQAEVAARFQKILLDGLKKEKKEELLKKYPFPKNVPLAKSPSLNPEIGAMLAEACKLRDKRLLAKQDQLGKALSALGKALTGLLKRTPDIPDIIRTLNDAGTILADSHYAETDTRRSVIMPLIDKSLAEPFKDRKRDTFLFGEKLGELVKDSCGIKKTGQLIQPPSTTPNLNARGPSTSRGTRYQRGGHTYQHRPGGPRAAMSGPTYQYQAPVYQYQGRRRAPPPPPPPSRRQPPPPPPTRRPPPPAQRSSTNRRT
ncbi:leiomodin-2-like [Leguminivora glycinivorella]|uniref:leiomodin-2-like n=1 Tax=Leguminivora glycinivorella TaxID=1035111 RepID=UPI00200E1B6A|nr:leiomodin-2-like [Leguminivora glycinivorella]